MPLHYHTGHITRSMLRDLPESMWIFGDNMLRQGLGGQAKEMRGEPNALGIATKWAPGTADDDYFAPGDLHDLRVIARMKEDFHALTVVLSLGIHVRIPAAGIGTGMADLKRRAPNILHAIERRLGELEERFPPVRFPT